MESPPNDLSYVFSGYLLEQKIFHTLHREKVFLQCDFSYDFSIYYKTE